MRTTLTSIAIAAFAAGAAAQTQPQPLPPGLVPDGPMEQVLAEAPMGTLAVQVVQGTEGGPKIGTQDITIELYHLDHVIKTIEATLDGAGVALIDDVPLPVEVRPVVRLQYSGVTYLEVGPAMSDAQPEGVVELTVYETTDEAPAWQVAMRHVMVEPRDDGVLVAETLVVENPADRTWMGEPTADGADRPTVRVRLPEGARQVQLQSGFHGWCCTAHTGRDLVVKMPLMPGRTSFRYSYLAPGANSRAEVLVSSPAPTKQAVFFVPDAGASVAPVALNHLGTEQMGQMRVNMYQSASLAGGAEAGVVLTGLRSAAPASAAAPGGDGSVASARRMGLLGLALVLAIAAGVVTIRMMKQQQGRAA